VAQRLFKACENGFIVSGFDIDDPVRRESSLRQRWSKQILVGNAPQHTTPGPRRDPGGEQCSGLAKRRDSGNVDRRINAPLLPVSQANRSLFVLVVLGVNGYVVRHGERRSGAQGGAAVTNEREVVRKRATYR